MSPRMLRTPLQSAIAATRHGWMRRSRPQKGMKALPGLQAMLAELPSLRQLRISNMRDVPQAAVSDLSARYPKLTIVRVDS